VVTKAIKPVQRLKYCNLKWFELLAPSGTVVYVAAVQYGYMRRSFGSVFYLCY
jgi:hypothetical protein